MSTHAVRDHVKNLFEKVAVQTRAELVAKLFVDPSPSDDQG
jgi:DNA-binding CsgD family transcriptional regulator